MAETTTQIEIAIPSQQQIRRWEQWDNILWGIGRVMRAGALLAVGGVLAVSAFAYGLQVGQEQGFLAGCNAAAPELCPLMAKMASEIRSLKNETLLPVDKRTPNGEAKIALLCKAMKSLNNFPALDAHFGCPQ